MLVYCVTATFDHGKYTAMLRGFRVTRGKGINVTHLHWGWQSQEGLQSHVHTELVQPMQKQTMKAEGLQQKICLLFLVAFLILLF